jgi:cathepsin L
MKYFALLFVFVAVAFAERLNVDEEWEKFKNQYNKAYTSVREEAFRKGVFAHHLNVIQRHNHKYGLGLKSYRLGVNEYADLMNSEFRQMMNGYKPSQKKTRTTRFDCRRKRSFANISQLGRQGRCDRN